MALIFSRDADFPAQPAGGVRKILSPMTAAAPEKSPKRPRASGKPTAEHEQAARKVPTLGDVVDGYGPPPFHVEDAARVTLAVVQHNARDLNQRARRQSLGDGATAPKSGQALRHQGRRSPHPEGGATTQSATDKNVAARPSNAASTSFSQIHAAVAQINAHRQATTVDGLSSISDASSENRRNATNFGRPAHELESFDCSGAGAAEEMEGVVEEMADDHDEGQEAGSQSREVSDASDAEQQQALPTQPERAVCDGDYDTEVSDTPFAEDYDIPVSDTPCTDDEAESEPEGGREGTDDEVDRIPRVRHNLWDKTSWSDDWRPWFRSRNWEYDNSLLLYRTHIDGLRIRDFPGLSHNGEVRRRKTPVGEEPDSSSGSDDGMPPTIGGMAGQNNGVLWDMWQGGNEQVKAYCLQFTRPTPDQIRDINRLAHEYLLQEERDNVRRGYPMLRPSEVDELHRACPTPLTWLAVEQAYSLDEREWIALKIEQTKYMRRSSIEPLSKKQLNRLDYVHNSPVARLVLRGGTASHAELRFLNRQNHAAELLANGTLLDERFAHQRGPAIYETALRLRNKRRAERTLPAERLLYIQQRLMELQSRPTIADWLIATERLRSFRAPAATMYLKLSKRHVDEYQAGVAAWLTELVQQMSLLRRNTGKARTMLHHLITGWTEYVGEIPNREEQLLILRDGLLAQQTVYGAYRQFAKLVAAEMACQQEYFDRHMSAEATTGTEQNGADYAADFARAQIEHLHRLTAENARLFERHARDYAHWQLQNPATRAAAPDTMTTNERSAKCAACSVRHSMVRLPCRMGPDVRRVVSFDSGTASPPRSEARLREAAGTQPQFRQGLAEFETAAREAIQRTGAFVRTRPMDYTGGAREAPRRHTAAEPSPTARLAATPETQARVRESPVRADRLRTVRMQTPIVHDMAGRPVWPGAEGRPRPGEPGWPGPPPN